MGSLGTKLLPEARKSIDSATFTGSYQAVGAAMSFSDVILKIVNNSNRDIDVSWDGVTAHDFVPASSFLLLDIAANKQLVGLLGLPKGLQIYVKGSSGTGLVYVSSYYIQ